MPEGDHLNLSHIAYGGRAQAEDYTHPRSGGGGEFRRAVKSRIAQAQQLFAGLTRTREAFDQVRRAEQISDSDLADYGLVLRVESEPGFPLRVESFDRVKSTRKRDSIELLNIRSVGDGENEITIAAVFVPYGKLPQLEEMIRGYEHNDTRFGRPQNEDLFLNIRAVRYAALEALWTDPLPLPDPAAETWWEVWIRRGQFDWEAQFVENCQAKQINAGTSHLRLPEHVIRLVRTTRAALESSLGILNCLAEVRFARPCSLPFAELDAGGQAELIQQALGRIDLPAPQSPAVCLLDYGVNRGHALIEMLLDENDMSTVDQASGTADHPQFPHGTQMAGLAAYGNVSELLSSNERWRQAHRLESVKILKNVGVHEPTLYGLVTQEAISLSEIESQRLRCFCHAVTAPPAYEDGRPSSWSAALDGAAAGVMEGDETDVRPRRVIFTAAGNYRDFLNDYVYPDTLLGDKGCIEDPAQSWNAVTVGAMTYFDQIREDTDEAKRCRPMVKAGELGPTSRTSARWTHYWPYKPDIVMEGGNMAFTEDGEDLRFHSLRPLTTSARFPTPFFTTFADTSAATAVAARLGARLQARYPTYWPETVRGLVIHSGRWTAAMLNGIDPHSANASETKRILRQVGWGVPDADRALASMENKATIVCENELQPFKSEGKTNHWHIHDLPWPQELLLDAEDVDATLRVTLSYLIEPNPGSRAVPKSHPTRDRYRYAGCGLRFEVKGPTDTQYSFQSRLNRLVTGEAELDYDDTDTGQDKGGWALGTQGRRICGSLHQDVWKGPAANLARMDEIAVLPVKGWWATRKFPIGHECHNCHLRKIRYSLIVSIETEASLPIYATIRSLIPLPGEIELPE
jgi:hypothetical protein